MMKKIKSILALVFTIMLLFSACNGGKPEESGKDSTASSQSSTAAETGTDAVIEEGAATNNGRPYNLTPAKYDSRDDKYLNGINATALPVSEEPITIDVWRSFSSTVMSGLDESAALQEMEKRTNIKVNWIYPPVGNEADNFMLRVSSDDLPHIFSCPPEYPGGVAKAVADEIYTDLTPYYDQGLMPNLKYLRENNESYARDLVDDEGRILFFPMMDVVPSSPWSGTWIRQDWLDELGLEVPTTIDEWDTTLQAFKKAKGGFVFASGLPKYYGVKTNYMFAGSYEAGFQTFINKDGTVVYGSIEPGYKDFLTLYNKWYTEGILDPDFATRTDADYNANVANGVVGAFGLAYGEIGQQKLTGQTLDPDWDVVPVPQPTAKEGQTIHLHQNNAIVRAGTDREYITTRAVDEGIAELLAKYKDYWYSQDGGDLLSYGPEDVSYKWGDNGEVEWIYPALTEQADADFWTLYPLFKVHNFGYLRDSTAYEFEPEVYECIDVWSAQDDSWLMPDNIAFTTEEAKELAGITVEVNAYVEEMSYKFITGQAPLSDFDNYVKQIKALNIDRAIEIQQAALERYQKR